MSCIERGCVCQDEDFTTSCLSKFCIDSDQEYAHLRKYHYRMIISVLFDCIVFPLIMLGGNDFKIASLDMYIGIAFFAIAILIHVACYLALRNLQDQDGRPMGAFVAPLLKSCVCLQCCCVFLCSYTRCMHMDPVECTQQFESHLIADRLFRSYNFLAAAFSYLGFVMGFIQLRHEHHRDPYLVYVFVAIILWMILDLLRLSWFCLKSIKKLEERERLSEAPIPVGVPIPQTNQGKQTYEVIPPQNQ